MRMRFLGANGNVTGSQHFVEFENFRFLVDCGMVQERDFLGRNWEPCLESASSLDAVFLTHAHLDHCGLLPKLVKDGFRGKIYATSATVELTKLILYDSAHIQEEDALFKQKRHQKEKRKGSYPVTPLYRKEDVDAVIPLLRSITYSKPKTIAPNVEITFHEAGHVLGSAFIEIKLTQTKGTEPILNDESQQEAGKKITRLLFSGDLGRAGRPILRDPEVFNDPTRPVDILVIESTYGDRTSAPIEDVDEQLADIINRTVRRDGKIIMPVFAVERAQEVLYRLHGLQTSGKISAETPIFLDSPMAVEATMIFKRHPECFDEETIQRVQEGVRLQNFSLLRTSDESRELNTMSGPAIIMSSSGMCNAGRIKHHLANHIGYKNNSIVFLGYQSRGTLGHQILDGASEVRIHGQKRKIRAEIVTVHGISGHADQQELLKWIQAIPQAPSQIFIVHGEIKSSQTFAKLIDSKFEQTRTSVPKYGEQFEF